MQCLLLYLFCGLSTNEIYEHIQVQTIGEEKILDVWFVVVIQSYNLFYSLVVIFLFKSLLGKMN